MSKTPTPGQQLRHKLSETYNQTDLAIDCGVKPQAVSAWCRDIARPTKDNAAVIQKRLGLSARTFLVPPQRTRQAPISTRRLRAAPTRATKNRNKR